jgi:hypothetical protein
LTCHGESGLHADVVTVGRRVERIEAALGMDDATG